MIKFAIVNEAPKSLEKGEYVIQKPTFLPEIQANRTKAPRGGLTGSSQLRYIADTIAMKYDPVDMSAWSVKPHQFEGRPYTSDEELSVIVVEMLAACYPKVFAKYTEYELNHLPPGTDTVYLVDTGVAGAAEPLLNKGFQRLDL